MYRIVEKFDNPLVSDNYKLSGEIGISRHANVTGSPDKPITNYSINFTERDSDLMLAIYKQIESNELDFFNTVSNGSWNGLITQLTHMESIKIITLYDIHVKELDLLASKQKLKDINNAIDNKQTRLY